jgi:GT2 family glycosyltransferase
MSTLLAIPRSAAVKPAFEKTRNTFPFPAGLRLTPRIRRPITLPDATVEAVLTAPLPHPAADTPSRKNTHAPRVSVIIPTFNNLVCNRLCLETLLATTNGLDLEVLVVDNGSTDGTRDYLQDLSFAFPCVQPLLADRNLGFAPAINWGLDEATGDYLVLLNNDVVLPPGWLEPLLSRLADSEVGMVGPVTNSTGNEAQIETTYSTYGEMLEFSEDRAARHAGDHADIHMLAMYFVALRRETYKQIGPLDERFEVGLFEDDDYSMRLRAAGHRLLCVEDAFVHHFGQASLGQLPFGAYGRLFHENRRRWEAKWGKAWHPYERRPNPSYDYLRLQIRDSVERLVPPGATILVVSKGDEELLRFTDRAGRHFPQCTEGVYAGHHPADSAEAIAHLEALRAAGEGQFLLFPNTAFWWLEHYADFSRHLRQHYAVIHGLDDSCFIYCLSGQTAEHVSDSGLPGEEVVWVERA